MHTDPKTPAHGHHSVAGFNLESHVPDLPRGMRMTKQRQQVFDVLMESTDHPTASDVFMRVKDQLPGISLATVYNCLDTLSHHGLIKQVNLDRAPSRFCANREDHIHFHCEQCGKVVDAPPLKLLDAAAHWAVPEGAEVTGIDVSVRGICPQCNQAGLAG
jgi:Fur family peroxide stress response transcriptional regulator